MEYSDGWYRIPHTPPKLDMRIDGDNQWLWPPRRRWLAEVMGPEFERWYMSGPAYSYSEGPNGPDKVAKLKFPLTWCFKSEKDAMMFVLRWGR
jgi:hypothetical protein